MLLLSRVDKPALLRRLFELGCRYSGQILSFTKMLGQLQEAGNTTTLAHYLDLLAGAGMLVGLQKYPGGAARRRGSGPKLQALNTALMTAQSGLSLSEARQDREDSGRLVETRSGPTSPMRRRRGSASSSTGGTVTVRWTSSFAPARRATRVAGSNLGSLSTSAVAGNRSESRSPRLRSSPSRLSTAFCASSGSLR